MECLEKELFLLLAKKFTTRLRWIKERRDGYLVESCHNRCEAGSESFGSNF